MSLSRMLKKIKKEKNELKILILGLDNAGKTTILHKTFDAPIEEVSPTFGYQIHTLVYDNKYNLMVLDVGGQISFHKYWSNYYEKLDGLIFVFDVSDERNFGDKLLEIRNDAMLMDVPLLIFANKCDLKDEDSYSKIVEMCDEIGAQFTAKKGLVSCIPCSGKTGFNLKKGFDWLVNSGFKGLENMDVCNKNETIFGNI